MGGGTITTGNHPQLMWPGVDFVWGRSYKEHTKEYPQLFDMETSSQNYEKDVEVTGFGLAPVKAQGASTVYDSELQGTISEYVHIAYSLGYIVTREELDDNLYEVSSKRRAQALAFSMSQTKENVGVNIYNRGFNASYTFGDGKAMLASDHPTVDGTQSNILPVAADLSELAIEEMVIQIMNAKNSKGLKISLMPKRLIVPTALYFEAERILKSQLQNDTANNAVNVLKTMGSIPEIAVNHYLTDPDAWFVRTNVPRGLVGFDRTPISFTQDNDFDTENAKAKCYERYSFGVTDFRGIYGTPGA